MKPASHIRHSQQTKTRHKIVVAVADVVIVVVVVALFLSPIELAVHPKPDEILQCHNFAMHGKRQSVFPTNQAAVQCLQRLA